MKQEKIWTCPNCGEKLKFSEIEETSDRPNVHKVFYYVNGHQVVSDLITSETRIYCPGDCQS